nr:ABC transporter ATP-binding protein [Williamsoniiplasma lucivorax]
MAEKKQAPKKPTSVKTKKEIVEPKTKSLDSTPVESKQKTVKTKQSKIEKAASIEQNLESKEEILEVTSVEVEQKNVQTNKSKKSKKEKSLLAELKAEPKERKFIQVPNHIEYEPGVKGLKLQIKNQKQLTSKYSKGILEGNIVSTTGYVPDVDKHAIELKNVKKSYISGDLETQVLKGIDIVLEKGDFIVILGPSGSGKTTFLNIISGLDKATSGDVFVLGSNLSLLKDSHLTKFRRKNVGFIFQQYNLLTNLTAKENAEVGENLSTNKNENFSIEKIFETIGMTDQLNKYPHQMSGGQQQRVSIARALTKNPSILFADEPTGALDEEMGRKVLEILVKINREFKTTMIVVTHNPNIAKIGHTIIHIKNGLIDELTHNANPADPSTIDWS